MTRRSNIRKTYKVSILWVIRTMTVKYECDRCHELVSQYGRTSYEIQSGSGHADKRPVNDFDLCGDCSDVITDVLTEEFDLGE